MLRRTRHGAPVAALVTAWVSVAALVASCGGTTRPPTLTVSSDLTAAVATAALGADATVVVEPDGPIVDADLLAELAPMPYGTVPPWTSTPPTQPPGVAPGSPDPAVWLDPDRLVQTARLLAARVDLDEEARARSDDRIGALSDTMRRADEQVQDLVLTRPAGLVVPTRNVRLAYFAERYGFAIQPITDASVLDPLDGLDLDHLGVAGSPTSTFDGMLVELARRALSSTR
jgi:hypothetical protein